MTEAPKGLRLHIALFGRRNAGKSSLLNALSGQPVSIVSDTPGTTTDPVEKTLEMAPLGPVVFLDTAGLDDDGELGRLRAERSLEIMRRTDVALLAARLRSLAIPFVVVRNKADADSGAKETTDAPDRPEGLDAAVPVIRASARSGLGLDEIRAAIERVAPESALRQPPLLSDLLPEQGVLLLVVPLDTGAPRGRLILPQVQAIRDSLDGRKICLATTDKDLPAALLRLKEAPDLVVCDSQVVHAVDRETPSDIPMTTFSVLMARFKGDLPALARGAAALGRLHPGDSVLIQEACSHHPQHDDIGRVKLPRLLRGLAGGELHFRMAAGKEFPDSAGDCAAVVHCGGCVITRGQMLARLSAATEAGCPMTNYGLAISLAQGVLARVLSPFPDALRAYRKARAQA